MYLVNFKRHAKTDSITHNQKIKLDFPKHTKLTMPALSPTMQQVIAIKNFGP